MRALLVMILAQAVFAQVTVEGSGSVKVTATGSFTIKPTTAPVVSTVQLPNVFVNNHECDSLFTYELTLPGTWVTSAAPGWAAHLPYALTQAGLQLAINDMEAYRTAHNVGIKLDIPPGLYSGSGGTVIPQTSNTVSSSCLILASTQDANLPDGRIVCGRGMQDNVAGATDVFVNNPNCISPNDVQYMWTVECTSNSNCLPLTTCSPVSSGSNPPQCGSLLIAPDHWLIMDAEVRMSTGNTSSNHLIDIGESGSETSMSQLPTHIFLRKVWVHGDWTSLAAGANAISDGFHMGCVYCAVTDSQLSRALRPGAEGHAIQANFGSQLKFDHNVFEGQASGLFCGGFSNGTGPSIVGQIPCTDLELRRNRITFPAAWLGQGTLPNTNPNFSCTPSCQSIGRKNATEFKDGLRAVIVGNIFENVDNSGGQGGPVGPDFTVRNNSAGLGNYYASQITDIYVYGNISRNGCNDFQLDARSGASSGGGVSQGIQRMWWDKDLHYNISTTNPGCAGANSVGPSWGAQANKWRGTIVRAANVATMTLACTPDVSGNCPAGPPGTGFSQTSINIGDPIPISGCTGDTSFNVPTHLVNGIAVPISPGPAAISGTLPNALTVVWASTGANSTDNSGNCQLSNVESWPRYLFFTHQTIITDAAKTISINNSPNPAGPNFAANNMLRDSIITGGGINSAVGEGTPTESFAFDVTTLTMDHMVFPTRTASKYTEYSNNSLFPAGPCMNPLGCSSPISMYYPATPHCTGATPNVTCVGFKGAMSATSMPLTLPDYHNFGLRPDSIFAAGKSAQASDGTDMGVSMTAIDQAQTQTTFVCPYTCGGTPFPD